MNYICEYSTGRPVVHAVWNKEQMLVHGFKVHQAAQGHMETWKGKLAANMLKQWENFRPPGHQTELFACLRFLLPARLSFATEAIQAPSAEEFVKLTFMTSNQLMRAEWAKYVVDENQTVNTAAETKDPSLWWSKPTTMEKYPTLAPFAVYLIHMPVVVTACDSAISMEGHLFSDRQSKLNTGFAGRVLAGRVNL